MTTRMISQYQLNRRGSYNTAILFPSLEGVKFCLTDSTYIINEKRGMGDIGFPKSIEPCCVRRLVIPSCRTKLKFMRTKGSKPSPFFRTQDFSEFD